MGRRILLVLLASFVAVGAWGMFGIRTRTVAAAGGGYRLIATYTAADRAQLPVRLNFTVQRPGGFAGPVDVGITQSYLNVLDLNDIEPQPSGSHSAGDLLVWTFDRPAGDTLHVTVDAIIEENAQFGRSAVVAVVEGAIPLVQVSFRTWVAP